MLNLLILITEWLSENLFRKMHDEVCSREAQLFATYSQMTEKVCVCVGVERKERGYGKTRLANWVKGIFCTTLRTFCKF